MIDLTFFPRKNTTDTYDSDINSEIEIIKQHYPYFSEMPSLSLTVPALRAFRVVAVSKKIIEKEVGFEDDYCGEYSKEIFVVVPADYKTIGCYIYGAKWKDLSKIPDKDLHIENGFDNNGYHKMCVGVPKSFSGFKHPILECIKTADRILTAYEMYLCGETKGIVLTSYSHGEKGKIEYDQDRKKYQQK